MTEHVLPPPGWYSDPELDGHVRWWDGTEWQHRAELPPRSGLGESFVGLATTLRVLLAVIGAVTAAMIPHALWGLTTVAEDLEQGEIATAQTYDNLGLLLGLSWMALLVAACVVWCVWQHRLARAKAHQVRRSPGMHAGSWFIPVVCLWFPFQNMRDLGVAWRVGWAPGVLGLWWTLWIVLNFTGSALFRMEFDDPEGFRTYNMLTVVDAVIWLVVTGLALHIVTTLTRAALTTSGAARGSRP